MMNFILGWLKASFRVKKLSIHAKISFKASIAKGVYSLGRVVISSRAHIGKGTYINSGIIHAAKIGEYCSISYDVKIGLKEHNIDFETMSPVLAYEKYGDAELANKPDKYSIIGNDVWVGANVVILQGVEIGDGAVIGASSIVTKNVPAFEVWAGVPAKKIKNRNVDHAF